MATTKSEKKVTKKEETSSVPKSVFILGPRITEKAAYASENNVFVFNVAMDSNKIQIKQAIKAMYNVAPTKIAIVVNKPKVVVFRGRLGKQSGFKKAYVTLKKGDTIDLN
jgi:large subunit ribosomal protein L23